MAVPDLLRRLLTAPGPSGYETAASAIWRQAAASFADVAGDTLGSSTARVSGTGGGPTLAVIGHIDEIGLMITHADENGFLSFLRVGGWRADVLVGQRLELLTSQGSLSGVVGGKASPPPRPREEVAQGAPPASRGGGVPGGRAGGPPPRLGRAPGGGGARAGGDGSRGRDRGGAG